MVNMSKHTKNKLKRQLMDMSIDEKMERLRELQTVLMSEKGKQRSNAMFTLAGHKKDIPIQSRMIRKQIAIVKTSLNQDGVKV